MAKSQFMGFRGTRLRMAMVVLVIAPSFILFGYNNGSTGGISTLDAFHKQFPSINTADATGATKDHRATVEGVVTGSYDLGAALGSLLCILYSERIGRIRTIFVGLVLSVIALAILASSFTLAQFVVGRLLIGVALGTISAAVPVWQSECSSASHRGAFVVLEGLFISSGISLVEWVEFGLSFAPEGSVQWRVPLIFPVIFSLFVMPFLFMMPESPRWLARMGRLDEARAVLAALSDEDEDSEIVNADMVNIEQSLSLVRGSLKELFVNGEERVSHRTALACFTMIMQQMCGISALVFYTSTIFANFGYEGVQKRILSTCLTSFQTCCAVVPMLLIDRVGRRTLFMTAGAGLAMCTAVIAGASGPAPVAACVFVFLYNFFYPLGFLGSTFLYAAELAPLRLRVPILAISNATQWLAQFVVAQVTPPGTTNLGSRYWIIFAVLNASFVVVIYFLFPETNGLGLEEVDAMFKESNSVFDTVKVSKAFVKNAKRERMAVNAKDGESKSELSDTNGKGAVEERHEGADVKE